MRKFFEMTMITTATVVIEVPDDYRPDKENRAAAAVELAAGMAAPSSGSSQFGCITELEEESDYQEAKKWADVVV